MNSSLSASAVKTIFHQVDDIGKYNKIAISVLDNLITASKEGMTTREIADECGLSIYSARNWLMKLENGSFVTRIPEKKGSRWFFDFQKK